MLLWGTVNPDGESDTHTGVLLRQKDIADIASTASLVGKPVKRVHTFFPLECVTSRVTSRTGTTLPFRIGVCRTFIMQ
jgi:hypothetical protein